MYLSRKLGPNSVIALRISPICDPIKRVYFIVLQLLRTVYSRIRIRRSTEPPLHLSLVLSRGPSTFIPVQFGATRNFCWATCSNIEQASFKK